MHRINIKPLSVNEAWKGRRFKTQKYKSFERELLLKLPKSVDIPADAPLKITFVFGLSSANADGDNCIKQAQDVISKKYSFNDRRITHWEVHKVVVAKGEEYIGFRIQEASPFLEIEALTKAEEV